MSAAFSKFEFCRYFDPQTRLVRGGLKAAGFRCPVLLTSIQEIATRSDLLDRCLIVWLPAIPEDQRRPEAELFAEFDTARPRILGALLDGVATALRQLPTIELQSLPRMADFALWATAAETAFGWDRGAFLAAYQGNRQSANDVALEASPVAGPLLGLLDERGAWSGTTGELLTAIQERVTEQVIRQTAWPKSPRSLSGHLKRLAPNLRDGGWQVTFRREARHRLVVIERTEAFASSPIFASSPDDGSSMQSDANCVRMTVVTVMTQLPVPAGQHRNRTHRPGRRGNCDRR